MNTSTAVVNASIILPVIADLAAQVDDLPADGLGESGDSFVDTFLEILDGRGDLAINRKRRATLRASNT